MRLHVGEPILARTAEVVLMQTAELVDPEQELVVRLTGGLRSTRYGLPGASLGLILGVVDVI